jgi:uncharacterized phage infection (PIP) family protein YhgE
MAGDRSLVALQASMSQIEGSLRDATTNLADFMTQLTDTVAAQTAGWTEGTPSRIAQRAAEQRLTDAVGELKTALSAIADEVDIHRERCSDIELENVAIVG